jgi:lipopolysaccharide transport system permease protein
MQGMLFSVWRYRFFIFSSIKTEFRARFIRSRLGGCWMILQPLSQVLIFAFILSTIMSARLPGITNHYAYAIYLMSGMLGWSLFSEIISRCLTLFIDNGNLIKKLAFPKITLPLIVVGSALVNNILLFCAIIVIFGLLGHWPGINLLWLPFLILVNMMLALSLGLILGVFNVFIRDLGQVIPIILQILFWFTPVVYIASIIPAKYAIYLAWNPLVPIITSYQNILLYDRVPMGEGIAYVALLSVFLLIIALVIFRKASAEMVDLL